MDKQTLSNYGWLIIITLVLAIMLALATPFGGYVGDAVVSVASGYVGASDKAIDDDNIGNLEQQWANKFDPLNPKGIIPNGATYTCADGTVLSAGDKFPKTPQELDIYKYGDYTYFYNGAFAFEPYFSSDFSVQFTSADIDGWFVTIRQETSNSNGLYQLEKSTYGEILESINSKPITSMKGTFYYCKSLTNAPKIPNSITDIAFAFYGCKNLIISPEIPSGITDMSHTFNGCTALTEKPIIPNSVTTADSEIFSGCTQFGY